MAEDIRALSAALARDPSSLLFVELAEALRKRGKLDEATQVAMHGLARHPEHANGFDCLARIHTDRGDLAEARAAWERALAIVPEHGGALKGIGFLYFRQGDTKRAADALEHAVAADPDDEAARRALAVLRADAQVAEDAGSPGARDAQGAQGAQDAQDAQDAREAGRRSSSAPAAEPSARLTPGQVPQLRATAAALRAALKLDAPGGRDAQGAQDAPGAPRGATVIPAAPAPDRPAVFAGLEGATADILLLDAHGLVMAGGLKTPDGGDASELAAAALAGVSGEASRTAGYLKLGAWSAIVAEAEQANVVLSPVGEGALLMLRRDKSTAVGLALRIGERARKAAAQWLEAQTP